MLHHISILFGPEPPVSYLVESSLDSISWTLIGEDTRSRGSRDDFWFTEASSSPLARFIRLVLKTPAVYEKTLPIYSVYEITVSGCGVKSSSTTLSGAFQLRFDMTPVVTSVSPASGSTAGGTQVIVRGCVYLR